MDKRHPTWRSARRKPAILSSVSRMVGAETARSPRMGRVMMRPWQWRGRCAAGGEGGVGWELEDEAVEVVEFEEVGVRLYGGLKKGVLSI